MSKRGDYGDAKRGEYKLLWPEDLTIETDESAVLYDPRVHLKLDESLVRSMMRRGNKVPVNITPDRRVIDGRQRTKAGIEANKRLRAEGKEPIRLKCLVEGGEEADQLGLLILANELRQQNKPIAVARLLARFAECGRDEAECAETAGVSVATVKNMQALLSAHPDVIRAVESGKLKYGEAYKIARLPQAEQLAALGGVEEIEESDDEPAEKKKKRKAKVDGKAQWMSRKEIIELREKVETEESISEIARPGMLAVFDLIAGIPSSWAEKYGLVEEAE
jgi:ParB family transcriptional regulator, chromosome partitioning protein